MEEAALDQTSGGLDSTSPLGHELGALPYESEPCFQPLEKSMV